MQSQSHTHTHTHAVGLLWTSYPPVADTSTGKHTTFKTDINAPAEFESAISAGERYQTHALDRGYVEARSDTTQQSGQTPDKEVEIKNFTVYVNGYTGRPDSRRR
jgi:hypothetical protein